MKRFVTIFRARAAREIDEARAWIDTNLGGERVALLNVELDRALDLLEQVPRMGSPAPTQKRGSPVLRHVTLARSGYHLYYRAHLRTHTIEVVCLWHEKRRPPKL
jgi:plasmid stabilization system protein ParE